MITRREFVARAAVAGAVLTAGRFALAQAPRGMYVSLNGSLTRNMPWPDFAALAAKLGYGGVDVNFNAAKAAGVDATRAMLDSLKLKPAICNLPVPYASADEAAFQDAMRQLDENAKFANAIGLNRMMVVLSPGSQTPKDERRKFLLGRLQPIAEILDRSKIRLGLEFLGPLYFRQNAKTPHQFIWTLPDTVAFAKECGANIGAVLDAWHWHHSSGTTAEIVAAGKAAIVHVHISDAKPSPPEEVRDNQRHMPGEGIIDLVGFLQALKTIGYADGVSPEPLGRVPAEMTPEEAGRLALETTTAVMKKAGVI
ncbi:MAG TPA: sugar phosphate isomerase/epimerase family protein [Vicinamibacterales bacterium]|jgi:sugar phosphate isomerase/epimerase